jgi:hypothetical protein
MALPNFDNTGFTTYVNSLNASGWTTFAGDMGTSFVGAFSSRFNLTTRDSSALGQITTSMQGKMIDCANWCSSALSGSSLLNVEASAFDYNPSGPSTVAGQVTVSVDFDVHIGIIPPSISFPAKITITYN